MLDPRQYVVAPDTIEAMVHDEEITTEIAVEALVDDILNAEDEIQNLRNQIEHLQAEMEDIDDTRRDAVRVYTNLTGEEY